MGEHHRAGYILESILNPNAVIVEGPGYTGPDWKSIMPDFRGQLPVDDLVVPTPRNSTWFFASSARPLHPPMSPNGRRGSIRRAWLNYGT